MAWYAGNPVRACTRSRTGLFGPYGWCFGRWSCAMCCSPSSSGSAGSGRLRGRCSCSRSVRQRRHVVRAVRDRDDQPTPRLPAVELEDVLPHLGRLPPASGRVRPVHDAVSDLHPVPAHGRHQRGQGRPARGGSARREACGGWNHARWISSRDGPLPSDPSLARFTACWPDSPGPATCWQAAAAAARGRVSLPRHLFAVPDPRHGAGAPAAPVQGSRVRLRRWERFGVRLRPVGPELPEQ